MNSSEIDQEEGTLLEGDGIVEAAAGELSVKPELEAESTGGNIDPNIQGTVGQFIKILGKD